MPFGISIRNKLLLAFFIVLLMPILVLGPHLYTGARQTLIQSGLSTVLAVRESKRQQLESIFSGLYNQIGLLGSSPATLDSFKAFDELQKQDAVSSLKISTEQMRDELLSWYRQELEGQLKLSDTLPNSVHELIPDSQKSMELQIAYIARNSYPFLQKFLLSSSDLLQSYDSIHRNYHGHFLEFRQRFNFRDVSLIDMQGNILYSTDKFPTFATNLLDGPWAETHQSRCFKNALIRDFAVEDFEPYLPALLESSAFLCKALISDNQIIGVISVQLSTHLLSRVMGDQQKWDEEQLGQSGKAYIVGGDFRVRHENAILYDDPQTQIPTPASPTRVNTDAVRAALRGESGTMLLQGPMGREVLCAYTNVRLGNGLWAILVEKELGEILAPISEALHRILPTMLFMLLAILFLGLWIAKNILGPIQLVTEKLHQLSRDEASKDSSTGQRDEAGKLLQAFDRMSERLKCSQQLMEKKILDLSDEKSTAQQAEMDLQKILQELPFGVQWKNLEGYIVGTNMAHELNFSQQRLPDLQTTMYSLESEFIRKGAGSTTKNLTLLDTDHNPVHVSCHLKLRRDSGANPVGILICLRDITEQVRIKSKAHIEDKIKALQNFAYGFCQKIAPIEQNSEAISLLEKYANQDINPQIQLNLVSIIEDALKQHFAKTPARINMIIKSQIRFIHGNPSLMQQAFKALTKKVAEVMPADGTLRIEIRNEPLNDMLHIRVMGQDTEATIPDPFTVFDPYSKYKLAEDGMALAIAFSIIRAHGGTIEVDSEPGIGTCFTIQLPVSNNFTSQNKGQI